MNIFFEIAKTDMDFKTRFKVNRKEFICAKGKPTFAEHLTRNGPERRKILEIKTIAHIENNPANINTLQ